MGINCNFCNDAQFVKVLPCLHVICKKCIPPFAELHEPKNGGLWKCTLCDQLCAVYSIHSFTDAHICEEFQLQQTSRTKDEERVSLLYHCMDCDQLYCDFCAKIDQHEGHKTSRCDTYGSTNRDFISYVVKRLGKNAQQDNEDLELLQRASINIEKQIIKLKGKVENKVQDFIHKITKRKVLLLIDIEKRGEQLKKEYGTAMSRLKDKLSKYNNGIYIAESVTKDQNSEFVSIHDELMTQLLCLSFEVKEALSISYLSMTRELHHNEQDACVDKILGKVVVGKTNGHKAHCFSVEYPTFWPIAIAFADERFMAVGKTGSGQKKGLLLLYSSTGKLHYHREYCEDQMPCDLVTLNSTSVLLTLLNGAVMTLNSFGQKINKKDGIFKGGGRAAIFDDIAFITSMDDNCIICIDSSLQEVRRILFDTPYLPVNIAASAFGDLVFTCKESSKLIFLTSQGTVQFTVEPQTVHGKLLTCITSLCFDSFDNLLVADFCEQSIWMFTSSGVCMGALYAGDDLKGPTAVTTDTNGQALIGQYEGQVRIFQYISPQRHI